jgi:hypothetical protein
MVESTLTFWGDADLDHGRYGIGIPLLAIDHSMVA